MESDLVQIPALPALWVCLLEQVHLKLGFCQMGTMACIIERLNANIFCMATTSLGGAGGCPLWLRALLTVPLPEPCVSRHLPLGPMAQRMISNQVGKPQDQPTRKMGLEPISQWKIPWLRMVI